MPNSRLYSPRAPSNAKRYTNVGAFALNAWYLALAVIPRINIRSVQSCTRSKCRYSIHGILLLHSSHCYLGIGLRARPTLIKSSMFSVDTGLWPRYCWRMVLAHCDASYLSVMFRSSGTTRVKSASSLVNSLGSTFRPNTVEGAWWVCQSIKRVNEHCNWWSYVE